MKVLYGTKLDDMSDIDWKELEQKWWLLFDFAWGMT
jgi:hypothetical protein